MSNRRMIRLLLLVNLLLAVLHVLLSFKGVGNVLMPRTTLMEALGKDQAVTRITITRRDSEPMVLEPVMVLGASNGVLAAKAGDWCLTHPYTACAEERLVQRLQDALALSPIEHVYREQDLLDFGRTRADYGLEEPPLRVALQIGERQRAFAFGAKTPTGEGVFVTVDGEEDIYVVGTNVLGAVDLVPDRLRQRRLTPEGVDTVNGFLLKRGSGSLVSFRLRDGQWQKSAVADETVVTAASAVHVRELLQRLGEAEAVDFVWPVGAPGEPQLATAPLLAGYGLDAESAVTLTLQRPGDAARHQVSFGKPATNGLVYALIQDNQAIVTVDGTLSEFVRTTDFTDPRLFPFEASAVSRLALNDGGVDYHLSKSAEGAWLLDEPVAAPTDGANVRKLLDRILTVTVSNRVETGLAVSVQTNAAPECVAREALLHDMTLADLRSRVILRLEPAEVRRLTLTDAKGATAAVIRDRDLRCWKPDAGSLPGTVSESSIAMVLSALNPLKAEKIVMLKASTADLQRYGLDQQSARWRLSVDPEDGGKLRRILLIGRPAQGGSFATLVGASETVFILSDDCVNQLTKSLLTTDVN